MSTRAVLAGALTASRIASYRPRGHSTRMRPCWMLTGNVATTASVGSAPYSGGMTPTRPRGSLRRIANGRRSGSISRTIIGSDASAYRNEPIRSTWWRNDPWMNPTSSSAFPRVEIRYSPTRCAASQSRAERCERRARIQRSSPTSMVSSYGPSKDGGRTLSGERVVILLPARGVSVAVRASDAAARKCPGCAH